MAASYIKVFVDWLERYRKLSDAELGRLLRAALEYKKDGTEVELTGREGLFLDGIRLDIDRDNEQYESICKERAAAGRKGAEARWQREDGNSHFANDKNGKCYFANGKNGKDGKEEEERLKIEEQRLKIEEEDYVEAEPFAPPGFTLKDGSRYVLTPDQMEQLANDFPGLSTFTIVRDIERWCEANPSKRKTEAGAMKFVNAWFVREREKRAQWREEAKARNEKPDKPEKKRTGKYDEIYDKY